MKYDLIVPAHPKDYIKLDFCLNSCLEYFNPKPENIYVITPDGLEGNIITSIKDEDAIQISQSDIKYRRPNWIFQMFVNLFQDFTENDLYMTVDSDVIFNREQQLFKDGKPVFFISDRDQHHIPYFDFMDKWSGLERQTDYTFINDYMMIDKKICREMLPDIGALLDFCNKTLSEDCLLADYELYGNFVTWAYPEMYETEYTKTKMHGKYVQNPWTVDQIRNLILSHKDKDIDLFTIHSWT
tara:strand:- start:1074 stop:1796 length:723 start_codon:yes stop_codon:yes gene_type:complete